MGRAVADVAIQNDKSRTAFGLTKSSERLLDAFQVIRIGDAKDIPAVGQKTRRDILGERDLVFPSMVM